MKGNASLFCVSAKAVGKGVEKIGDFMSRFDSAKRVYNRQIIICKIS